MYYVYVIKSLKNGRYYTGSTSDVERRFVEHSIGKNLSTRNIRPFELALVEQYETKSEALKREKYLKTGRGRDERDRLFRERGPVAQLVEH